MDDIRILEAKLLQSETENQRLREQLHGLILLVKKAWTGDHSAAIDVALIVGVARPTLEVSSMTDEMVAVPKSPCINNWFRLTVGLINKEYKEKQTTAKAQQMLHFRNREAFIDEQMENSTYNREPKPGEVERRASLLHDLVENENIKRNELKLKLGMLSPETPSLKPKTRVSSAKLARSSKSTNTEKMDECLVFQSRSTGASKERQLPLVTEKRPMSEEKHKIRAKSAGRRRPGSAITASTPGKTERPRSGIKKTNKGRIEDKLNKTESDIALTVQLLQQRLGIDGRGMV
ncbi:Hypothetical predicted protein [Paramuricea clavata]|uniref:Uncharacterized protein n=1 Tax=Paramuricea clavata TaxID=317549 RepID=A0A7D9D553_PARCT|nr:Hypothetical predicted protein [Paramuricea clavata]